MHIILGEQNIQEVSDKYVVLPLDTFRTVDQGEMIQAFCLIENVPIQELPQVDQYRDLHTQLIKNYGLGNWKFCEDALEHLVGRWNGEVDSFYHDLSVRIMTHKQDNVDLNDWDPTVQI